jgi:hypothetical protein
MPGGRDRRKAARIGVEPLRTLRNLWHPIAVFEAMTDQPARFTSHRPQQIATDLRDELHLKIPDASGIAYRRLLGQIDGAGAFMP